MHIIRKIEDVENRRFFSGVKTAIAMGYFDGVHRGHKHVIETVIKKRENGFTPCVFSFTINKNSNISKAKKENIQTNKLKIEKLEKMDIDYLIMPSFEEFAGLSAEEFIVGVLKEKFGLAILCCGQNFKMGKNASADIDEIFRICSRNNIELIAALPVVDEEDDSVMISSTNIRQAIKNADIKKVNNFLGETYCYEHEVIKGRQLAGKLGFNTANGEFEEKQIIPKYGVYASVTKIEDKLYKSITNIGIKPTVSNDLKPISETHIIGLNRDIYGKTIRVYLVDYLREEKKFNSLDELKDSISYDTKKLERYSINDIF